MVYRMKISEFEHGLVPDSEGDLVDYDDYAALDAANQQLRAQLAEARALLISSWAPTDDTGQPCLEWVKRRNTLLVGRSE